MAVVVLVLVTFTTSWSPVSPDFTVKGLGVKAIESVGYDDRLYEGREVEERILQHLLLRLHGPGKRRALRGKNRADWQASGSRDSR